MRTLVVLTVLVAVRAFAQSDGGVISAPPVLSAPEDAGVSEATAPPTLRVRMVENDAVVFDGAPPKAEQLLSVVPGHYEVHLGDAVSTLNLSTGDDLYVPGTWLRLQATLLKAERGFAHDPFILRSVANRKKFTVTLAGGLEVDPSAALKPLFGFSIGVGLTARLQWSAPLPHFTYLLGDESATEWLIDGGAIGLGVGNLGAQANLTAGLTFRRHLPNSQSVIAGAHVSTFLTYGLLAETVRPFSTGSASAQAGFSRTFGRAVTINPAVSMSFDYPTPRGRPAGVPLLNVYVGAMSTLGIRPLPLVQLHVTERWSFDVYYSLGTASFLLGPRAHQTLMVGVSYAQGPTD